MAPYRQNASPPVLSRAEWREALFRAAMARVGIYLVETGFGTCEFERRHFPDGTDTPEEWILRFNECGMRLIVKMLNPIRPKVFDLDKGKGFSAFQIERLKLGMDDLLMRPVNASVFLETAVGISLGKTPCRAGMSFQIEVRNLSRTPRNFLAAIIMRATDYEDLRRSSLPPRTTFPVGFGPVTVAGHTTQVLVATAPAHGIFERLVVPSSSILSEEERKVFLDEVTEHIQPLHQDGDTWWAHKRLLRPLYEGEKVDSPPFRGWHAVSGWDFVKEEKAAFIANANRVRVERGYE